MTAISTGSRALRRNTNRDSLTEGADLRTWTGHGIEVAWLIAAVVAPVVVLSETAFISKTELPKVATVRLAAGVIFLLMLLDAGMTIWQKSVTVPSSREQLKAQVARLVSSPRTRLVTSVLGLLLATALASAFALMPDLSTWGVNPGGESNSLYTTASYTVLFFAVATRLKTPSQLWRLLSAIVLAGTICALIGIAQHFGHAPLGIRSTSGSARVSGTAGNPIFFATILIVTLLITVGMSLSIRELTRKTLTWLTVSGLVIAIHFAALMVTLSRGPWIGAAVGLLAVSTLAPLMFGQSRSFRTGFLVISAFLVALAFLGFASTPDGVTGPGIERTSVNDIQGRATTLAGVFDPVSNPRLTRWDGAVDLALNRPEPPSGAQPGYLVRSLFGYGPDSFADVFTLVAPQRLSGTRTTAAHNVPLNQLVETGVIGLLAWMALWTSLVHLLLRDLWMHRQDGNARQVATLAIGASLMAWFVAGLTGIPQTGDTVLVWLLIGVAAAIPNVFATSDGNVPAPVTTTQTPSPALQTSAIVAIGLIALAAIWISWTENVQRVSADSTAASAVRSDTGNPDVDGRLSDIDGAISLSPDQPRYHTIRSEIYERVALELASQNPFAAMQESVDSAERALALNPLDRDLNFRAAYVNWELAKMGDPDSALRTYHLYQELALMSPQHQSVGPRLTAIGEALGLTP